MLSGEAKAQFEMGVVLAIKDMHIRLKQDAYQAVLDTTPSGSKTDAQAAADAIAIPALHPDHIIYALPAMVTYVAPNKSLVKQKRWLRRFCRKPHDMSIRIFANHVTCINRDELPNMPPFGTRQGLMNDEIIDIILNGIPCSWMRKMDKQDFDPVEKTLSKVIHFCECMEAAEDSEPACKWQGKLYYSQEGQIQEQQVQEPSFEEARTVLSPSRKQ